jgi:hypothetical protein
VEEKEKRAQVTAANFTKSIIPVESKVWYARESECFYLH